MATHRPDSSRTEGTTGSQRAKPPTAENQPGEGGIRSAEPHFSQSQTGASASATRIYDVQEGDTLASIARAEYGREEDWTVIFEANRDRLRNAEDTLEPGCKLVLPVK